MHRAAAWAGVLGTILILGSCLSAAASLYRAFTAELILDAPLEPGRPATTNVTLERRTRLRVALEAEIRGDSVQEVTDAGSREYALRYRIPVRYRIERGDRVLRAKTTAIAWDRGAHSVGDDGVGRRGGAVATTTTVTRLVVTPGPMRISIETGEDVDYQSTIERLRLEIYRDAVGPLAATVRWFLLLAGGAAALALALILWLIAAGRDSPPQGGDPAQAKQFAACCHASGLIGFVIPFGNLIVPLLLWLMMRETHAFVDQQGKEAVNFQLSFTCYYLISVLLILILIGIVLLVIVFLLHVTFMVIATAQSYNGADYRYPLTFRLVR